VAEELLCVGLTTLDVAARPVVSLPTTESVALVEQAVLAPAGTAAGTALIAARLGVATALASLVGGDSTGRTVRMLLEVEGVDTTLLGTHEFLPTSTTVILIDPAGRRSRLHALGASLVMGLTADATAAARRARFVHYAGIGANHLDGGPGVQLLAAAKAAGATVSCDLISPRTGADEELRRLLPHVDYFIPNAAEAAYLSGTDDLAAAARRFRELGARVCIIKDGEHGSLFASVDRSTRIPAHIIQPIDTTSCGDGYCAGFIAALARGRSEIEACHFATAVAALVAQSPGTLGKVHDFASTDDYRKSTPVREIST